MKKQPTVETSSNQVRRNTSENSRYTFSGKERDGETGYSYFGARYYNSDISIWLSVDPLSDKYPHQSNYVYCSNNPIRIIDPNGEDEYEIFTNKDGKVQINVVRNDDKTNSYTYRNADGSEFDLGTYDKTGGLVKLDKSKSFYEQVNYEQGNNYMNGDVAAGFLAGMYEYNVETGNKVEITQLNNAEGGHSSHTGSGTNADVKYANLNGYKPKESVWTSGSNFDKANSQKLVDAFTKFGFNSPKGSILTENGQGNGPALGNSIFVNGNGKFHHKHHIHLQKFNTSIINEVKKP
jgi:RHS repeat-associated protein